MEKNEAIRILRETSVTAATSPGTEEWDEALHLAITALIRSTPAGYINTALPLYIDLGSLANSVEVEGVKRKSVICMEECSELIKAISKLLRGEKDELELKRDLAEEIGDVFISLCLLIIMYDISWHEIQEWIWFKIQRQEERDKKILERRDDEQSN
jgi:NTP pyrophosphatase (non-canonical NTP hydrolase)